MLLPFDALAPFQLRDYQAETLDAIATSFFNKGLTRQLVVLPTASGKTVCFSELNLHPQITQWLETFPRHRRKILVIAQREELLDQAKDKILRSNPTLKVGIEQAARHADTDCDIVVASVQTLSARTGKRLNGLDPDEFRIVVIDEAHHVVSPSHLFVLQYFGFLPPNEYLHATKPHKHDGKDALLRWQRNRLMSWDQITGKDQLLLGVTATPNRGDRIGLEAVFQDVVYHKSIRDLVEAGWLSRVRGLRVLTNVSIDDVKTRAGDFATEQLAKAVDLETRNKLAVKAYLEHANGRQGVTFCVTVAHANAMAEAYKAAGVAAALIHGGTPTEDRRQMLEEFRKGNIKMLTNCAVLTEGVDLPSISVIIHARPTKSQLLYIQMSGRGLRLAPDKTDCLIIDLVDITKKHSLVTSPELLGLPAGFDAKGEDLLDMKQRIEKIKKENPLADVEDVKSLADCEIRVQEVDLLGRFHDENLEQHAQLAWRRTGDGYEIDWRGGLWDEAVEVNKTPTGWEARHIKGQRSAWQKTADSAKEALRTAETYMRSQLNYIYTRHTKAAPWRNQPASPPQKDMVKRLGLPIDLNALTAGQASQLIGTYYSDKRKAVARRTK